MSQDPPAPMDLPVDKIIEAPWNVNLMEPDLYKQLVQDMKANGPRGINPISVAGATQILGKPYTGYVTIDGAHKLRAAKELNWQTIPAFYHQEILNESQARLFNYHRDAERGTIDQFKLAQTFKWYTEQGLDQQKIAVLFGIDRSTVTKRIGLLNLDPKVRDVLVEKEGLDISHLEAFATVEPRLQKIAAANLHDYHFGGFGSQAPTVKGIEHVIKDVKARDEAEQIFRKHLEAAKFKKCPVCKRDPQFSRYQPAPKFFRCSEYHEWNGLTGEQPKRDYYSGSGGGGGHPGPSKPPGLPQHVKSSHKPEEYEAAMWPFLKQLWSKVKDVESCSIGGTLKAGRTFSLEYNGYHFAYSERGGGTSSEKNDIEFAVEEITSKDYKKKGLYSRIKPREGMGQGIITKADQLKDLEEVTEKFLQDYGKTPRSTPVKYEADGQTTSFIPAAIDKVRKVPHGTKAKK